MSKKLLSFIFLFFLLVPLVSHAQGSPNYNEHITIKFPITNNTVNIASDYFAYLVATDKPSTGVTSDTSIWMALYPGIDSSTFSSFMQVGIATNSIGYTWFVSTDPMSDISPKVECLRGNEVWFNSQGKPTGCVSNVGDIGVGKNQWLRVQMVTYGQGYWIVRIKNFGTNQGYDVARIYNPNIQLKKNAEISMEESWYGSSPTDNPWLLGSFYAQDFKYRTPNGWAHMPSNIGGDYGTNFIRPYTNSGSDSCPSHYGVTPAIQNNPYLWFMGTGGTTCNGYLYSGGGPNTAVMSIVTVSTSKFLSSENGANCVHANRSMPGIWEEWFKFGGNTSLSLRGNNGTYIRRTSNNDLWEDTSNTSDSNAQFIVEDIPNTNSFRLKNRGNNLYVDHNSSNGSCVRADAANTGGEDALRFVAY